MAQHNDLGRRGEEAAARYLMLHGYDIKDMDWHLGHKDIDIIAEKRGLLVFVEVKTRRNHLYGEPEDAVDRDKIRHLLSAAHYYIIAHELDMAVRFDILSVVGEAPPFEIKHIKDAFDASDWNHYYEH